VAVDNELEMGIREKLIMFNLMLLGQYSSKSVMKMIRVIAQYSCGHVVEVLISIEALKIFLFINESTTGLKTSNSSVFSPDL
jgi:hypothetical protein